MPSRPRPSEVGVETALVRSYLRELTQWINSRLGVEGVGPDSILKREIVEQHSVSSTIWQKPASYAGELVAVLSLGCMGHADALDAVFESTETPHPHAVHTLMRAAIEYAARTRWVADPVLSLDERARRVAIFERYSVAEQMKLALDDRDTQLAKLTELDADAVERGWPRSKKALSEQRLDHPPSTTRLVQEFYDDDQSGIALGDYLYRFTSAIAHGTTFSLVEYAHSNEAGQATIGMSSKQANSLLIGLGVTIQHLGWTLLPYLGWSTDEWRGMIQIGQDLPVDLDAIFGSGG